MTDIRDWSLYLVTDRVLSLGRSLIEICQAAIKGGVSVIQLREKNLDSRTFLKEGLALKDLLARNRIPFIINDRIDIALALDADGVHLGQSDIPLQVARKILGHEKIIGWSIDCPEQILSEEAPLADYLAIGPIFHTGTKTDAAQPWGLEGMNTARSMTEKPLVAIGGINENNLAQVIGAGADSAAVVSAIVAAEDVESATRKLLNNVIDSKRLIHKKIGS